MTSRDLTEGSIPKHLMSLALPVAGALLLQSAYALVDLSFVRRLGGDAVAGLSISFQAFFVVLALSQIVAATALAEMSQDYGAGRVDRARSIFSTFCLVGAAVGVVSGLAAWLFADAYVDAFTDDPNALALGIEYFQVSALTFLLQLLLIVFGSGLRASGDFMTPMKVMSVSVLCNALLDPILIFGWGPIPAMGLAGAAWATVTAQLGSTLVYLVRFSRPREGRALYWRRPCWSATIGKRLIVRGLPAGVQYFLLSAVVGGILAAMKPYGPDWTATAGGGFRVMQQTFLPIVALGSAAGAIAGQNLGAGRIDRLRLVALRALKWAAVYGVVISTVLGLFGRQAGLVFAESEQALDLAQLYFWWSAASVMAFSFTYIPTLVLQATGRALAPMLSATARVGLLWVLIFVVFPRSGLSPDWIFGMQMATAWMEGIVSTAILLWYLKHSERLEAIPKEIA